MSAEAASLSDMANVQRAIEDVPMVADQSDDLFGEDSADKSADVKDGHVDVVADLDSKAPATDLFDNVPPTPADSQPVDPQDALPVTDEPSGIEGVAKFIPSDANLNQPVLSPSEPLGDGEARIDEDVDITDAPSLATEVAVTSVSEPQATEGSNPAGVDGVVDGSSTADTSTNSNPLNGVAGNSALEDSQPTSVQTSPVADLPNGRDLISESTVTAETESDMKTRARYYSQALPADASVDQEMSDAPSAGTVRAREDDDIGEPSAKRTKTEDTNGEAKVESQEDSKAVSSSAPAPAPPASAGTNGSANVIRPQTTPRISSGPVTKTQKIFLIEKMKNTKKVKSAFWFTKPVDYVALNIPHYPTIVKQPMDLTTIEHKLKSDEYASVDDLVADFELMVTNCFTFNGINHVASISAQNLRAYFMKQMQMCPTGESSVQKAKPVKKSSPKPTLARAEPVKHAAPAKSPAGRDTFALLPDGTPMIRRDSTAGRPKRAVIPPAPRDLPYATSKPRRKEAQTGLKFCEHILDVFRKSSHDHYASPFRIPVDPVALNIPNYFSIIRQPMDVSTITQKLKGGQYASATEFKNDFDLMFSNCYKFNPQDNLVNQMGHLFQAEFEKEWSKKDTWIKRHAPRSQRTSPASDGSDGEESEEGGDEDDEHDNNEATIHLLREQLAQMQNMVASIAGSKRASPKAAGNKKKGKGATTKTSKKASISRPAIKMTSKPKKQRLVTYNEKQEISSATENMTAEQVEKLTTIITENVSKYKDMAGDDVELEIDDLPNEVQHKLLRYVRSIFPKTEPAELDANAIDDDYEPEKPSARAGGAAKKKHKPMKKHEQEDRIKQLKEQMAAMSGDGGAVGGGAPASAPPAVDSSDDDDSESSEEE